MKICILALCLILSACVSNDYHTFNTGKAVREPSERLKPPQIADWLFDTDVFELSPDIFELEKEQQLAFAHYFEHPDNSAFAAHERVANYIDTFSQGFTYRGETLNAAQAFATKSGNCLSLAILSTALAQAADIKFQYNVVHSAPVYKELSNVQLISSHVNVTLFAKPKTEGEYWTSGSITIDYFRTNDSYNSGNVTPAEIQSMYWNNLASEAIVKNDVNLAYWYTMKSQEIIPLYPDTLNLLAILYKRKDRHDLAFELYDFMDRNNIDSFSSIDNFADLLEQRGDKKRAGTLRSKIQHLVNDNPYTWLELGKQHFSQGKYSMAENYLLKSRFYGPYLQEPLDYLAALYIKQNRNIEAQEVLLKARALAHMPEDEKRYMAKIYSLK